MINETFRCINCRHHELSDKTCRRYAPKPGDGRASWPNVKVTDWCGDFKMKYGEVVFVNDKTEIGG